MSLGAGMMEGATTLRDVLVVLFKHKAMLLIVFMAIVVPVTVTTFLLPPVYEATSSFLIKFGREYLYRPEVSEGKAMLQANYSLMQEALINSELEILTSRDLKEKIIASFGVDNLFPARAGLANLLPARLGLANLFPARRPRPAQDRN